jgi:hypothetical protein
MERNYPLIPHTATVQRPIAILKERAQALADSDSAKGGVMPKVLMLALLFASTATAAERLSLGTLKKDACRAHLYLEISAPQFKRVQGDLQFCAERGVQAARLNELVDNRNGAASRFWQEFQQCSRYVEWDDAELAVERSCRN